MQYVFVEPGITVTASGIAATVEGFGAFKLLASQYLLDEGIGRRGPDGMIILKNEEWYDAQAYLNAWKRISNEVSEQVLENAGCAVPEKADFPPQLRSLETALGSLDIAYHMNHRKNGIPMYDALTGQLMEGIGHYQYKRTSGKNEVTMTCDNPYPCVFDRGLLLTLARRFEPQARLVHVPTPLCRRHGGECCQYVIHW